MSSSDPEEMAVDDDFKGCPEGIPSFEPGLESTGSQLSVKVLSAAPAEPERYTNSWTVELDLPEGTPATAAHIEKSQTFMPIHGHDGMVVPEITALSQPGQFQVDRLTFTMRGPWEVRFWLQSTAAGDDYIVLNVCVAK